ncbi:IS66 family insertion sequence element accessory protein TnpB [Azotobacter chroococcum]|uniref:IS66 family insertion sequence element accessory protein TnpB n=1 Tax=Azotobacter chroococcum TaxID=353 RepID=UPI001396838D|nr:IS66 family insertion sequence element accessory protein TnpB [Azotobacter chroococcum]
MVAVFGAAKPQNAYLFANKRANRMKVLIHDGFGVWLASRRRNRGRFVWPASWQGAQLELNAEQLQALVVGLPWQRVGSGAEIRLL